MAEKFSTIDSSSPKSGNRTIEDPHARMLDKLRKILERAKSPNEGEAGVAADMLRKFLEQHNLSMADLEKKGGKLAPEIHKQGHDLGKAAFKWKLDLAEAIARFYYCESLIERHTKMVAFVGRPDNVEALTMLYGWIIEQIRRLSAETRRAHFDETGEHVDPLRWQLSFGVGVVERLEVRLTEMKARQEEDAAEEASTTAIALYDQRQREISDWLEEQYGYRRDGKETKRDRERRERY